MAGASLLHARKGDLAVLAGRVVITDNMLFPHKGEREMRGNKGRKPENALGEEEIMYPRSRAPTGGRTSIGSATAWTYALGTKGCSVLDDAVFSSSFILCIEDEMAAFSDKCSRQTFDAIATKGRVLATDGQIF